MCFILTLRVLILDISKDCSCFGSFKSSEVGSAREVVNFLQPATQKKCHVEIYFGPKLFPDGWCVCAAVLELPACIFHITLKR